jgi:hypothetical protein
MKNTVKFIAQDNTEIPKWITPEEMAGIEQAKQIRVFVDLPDTAECKRQKSEGYSGNYPNADYFLFTYTGRYPSSEALMPHLPSGSKILWSSPDVHFWVDRVENMIGHDS